MNDSVAIIIISVCVILGLVVAFYIIDKFIKGDIKFKTQPKQPAPKKEEPIAEPPKDPEPVVIAQSHKVEAEDEEKTYRKNRGRISEYHRNKWGSGSSVEELDVDENQDMKLTDEDMKKLIALRDLFDKK